MSETTSILRGILYIIACAASSAALIPNLVMQAQAKACQTILRIFSKVSADFLIF